MLQLGLFYLAVLETQKLPPGELKLPATNGLFLCKKK
jgi:hypothetical protein